MEGWRVETLHLVCVLSALESQHLFHMGKSGQAVPTLAAFERTVMKKKFSCQLTPSSKNIIQRT